MRPSEHPETIRNFSMDISWFGSLTGPNLILIRPGGIVNKANAIID